MKKTFNQILIDNICEFIRISKYKKENGNLYLIDDVSFYRSELADAFEKYGWSFVQSLGVALRKADHINAEKLINTFQEYVIQYAFEFIKPTKKNA